MPSLVSMEDITSLEPGQAMTRTLQVRFHHHLLPLKLALHCDDKRFTVRLRPDIGYFVRALPMDVETFINKESQLPGMFEYKRRSVTKFCCLYSGLFLTHKRLQTHPQTLTSAHTRIHLDAHSLSISMDCNLIMSSY